MTLSLKQKVMDDLATAFQPHHFTFSDCATEGEETDAFTITNKTTDKMYRVSMFTKEGLTWVSIYNERGMIHGRFIGA